MALEVPANRFEKLLFWTFVWLTAVAADLVLSVAGSFIDGFKTALVYALPSHPGTSLHPSSPSPSPSWNVSSVKPLPTHNSPMRPLVGKGGPKAAGLAAKEVLLSSAIVIMAFGGKSVKGAEKEKNDLKGEASALRPCDDEATGTEGCVVETTARHNRKTQAAKKRERMAILGGRMFAAIRNVKVPKIYGMKGSVTLICWISNRYSCIT